jgi:hypothetical protein
MKLININEDSSIVLTKNKKVYISPFIYNVYSVYLG